MMRTCMYSWCKALNDPMTYSWQSIEIIHKSYHDLLVEHFYSWLFVVSCISYLVPEASAYDLFYTNPLNFQHHFDTLIAEYVCVRL